MITKDDLLKEQEKLRKDLIPAVEDLNKAKKKFDEVSKHLQAPFMKMLEDYYDENLKDINGEAIRVGDKITDHKSKYVVVDRGMQFALGEMMFNPRVMVKKVDKTFSPNAKPKHIFPSELAKFKKI